MWFLLVSKQNWESVAELLSSGGCQTPEFIGKTFSSVEFRAETPISAKICSFVAVQSGVDTGAGVMFTLEFLQGIGLYSVLTSCL